jgi:hypothetical protein
MTPPRRQSAILAAAAIYLACIATCASGEAGDGAELLFSTSSSSSSSDGTSFGNEELQAKHRTLNAVEAPADACDAFPWTASVRGEAGVWSMTRGGGGGGAKDDASSSSSSNRGDGDFFLQIVVTGLKHDPARVDEVWRTWVQDARGIAPPPMYATAVPRQQRADDSSGDGRGKGKGKGKGKSKGNSDGNSDGNGDSDSDGDSDHDHAAEEDLLKNLLDPLLLRGGGGETGEKGGERRHCPEGAPRPCLGVPAPVIPPKYPPLGEWRTLHVQLARMQQRAVQLGCPVRGACTESCFFPEPFVVVVHTSRGNIKSNKNECDELAVRYLGFRHRARGPSWTTTPWWTCPGLSPPPAARCANNNNNNRPRPRLRPRTRPSIRRRCFTAASRRCPSFGASRASPWSGATTRWWCSTPTG